MEISDAEMQKYYPRMMHSHLLHEGLETSIKKMCDATDELCKRYDALRQENKDLQADRDRLDFLDNEALCAAQFDADPEDAHWKPVSMVRTAIDRAMKSETLPEKAEALRSIPYVVNQT